MDDSAPLADSTTMKNSSFTKCSLLALPNEIIEKVVSLVDNPSLISLRLVSKSLCAIAERPFAIKNFASSHHVVTRHSFETLLAISAHSIFGAYIKSIMICPIRIVTERLDPQDMDDDAEIDDSFVESGGFSDLMSKTLTNVKQHSVSLTVGILSNYGGRCSTHRIRFHGADAFKDRVMGVVSRQSETLELLVAEMHAAAIHIDGLHFNTSIARGFAEWSNLKMYKAVTKFLMSRDSPIDLRFTWDNGLLDYNHSRSRLCFSASAATLERAHPDIEFIEETVQYLSNTDAPFSDVYLQDLDLDSFSFFDVFLTPSLQTITLEDIRSIPTPLEENFCSALFQRLARLPNLKHCKLQKLQYCISLSDPPVVDPPSKFNTIGVLIFPDGKSKVEMQGADLSRQLEDLAAYAAAAEQVEPIDHRLTGPDTPFLEEEDTEVLVSLRVPVAPACCSK